MIAIVASKPRRNPEVHSFGYTRGAMAFPVVLAALSVVELVIVHLLVPWLWLKVVLLVLTAVGIVAALGGVALRMAHPHLIDGKTLRLRWGRKNVLETLIGNVAEAVQSANHVHVQPTVDGDTLVLTAFRGANLRVRFVESVEASPPLATKHVPEGFRAIEVLLYVEEPGAFVAALGH